MGINENQSLFLDSFCSIRFCWSDGVPKLWSGVSDYFYSLPVGWRRRGRRARLFLFVTLELGIVAQQARLFLFVTARAWNRSSAGTIISIRYRAGSESWLFGHDYFYSLPSGRGIVVQRARLFLFVTRWALSPGSAGTIIPIRYRTGGETWLSGNDYRYSLPNGWGNLALR